MQSEELQWRDQLSDKDTEVVEYAISLVATLCVQTLQSGLAVGFATNMPLGKAEESTLLLPAASISREEELLTAFARLSIRRTDSFYALLDSLAGHTGLDIIVISRYTSERIEGALHQLRQSGNRVYLHLTGGDVA